MLSEKVCNQLSSKAGPGSELLSESFHTVLALSCGQFYKVKIHFPLFWRIFFQLGSNLIKKCVVYSMNMHFLYKFRIHLENKWSKISILFFHLSITLTWIRHFRNVVKENKEEKRELYNGSEKCVEMYICFNVAAHFLTRTTIHFNSTFWWIFAENSCTSTAHLNSQHDKIVT